MMGNSKHQQHVYVHGSINGYLERDIETYTPKKFFYIKIEKSGHKYYLGAENNLVDESHAVNFSEKRVLEIIMEMKENPYYKNCEILPFETSRKLNNNTETGEKEMCTVTPAVEKPIIERPALEPSEHFEQSPRQVRGPCMQNDKSDIDRKEQRSSLIGNILIGLAVIGIVIAILVIAFS